jgi:hypothetical protein
VHLAIRTARAVVVAATEGAGMVGAVQPVLEGPIAAGRAVALAALPDEVCRDVSLGNVGRELAHQGTPYLRLSQNG